MDLIIDVETIQHLDRDGHVKVYADIVRCLKPGGRFFMRHWREGDWFGSRYPELRFWSACELGPLIAESGLDIEYEKMLSRASVTNQRMAVWYCMGWRKP